MSFFSRYTVGIHSVRPDLDLVSNKTFSKSGLVRQRNRIP